MLVPVIPPPPLKAALGVGRAVSVLVLLLFPIARAAHADSLTVGQSFIIHSSVLDEDRTYHVALPESYRWETGRRYPVLVVLDGESQFLHTAVSAGFLAKNGDIPEMIVVGIVSSVRIRDYTQSDWSTAWVGGGGAENFKRFLSTELLPEIDRTYRTDGFRVLSGHSAAGQFVLYCLSAEPSLFRAYLALSPSLDWDNNLPQRSLEQSFRSTPAMEAFLYVARSDDFGQALADFEHLVATLEGSAPHGLRWSSQAFPDETHSSMSLRATIDALRSLYAGYRFHNDMIEKGFAYAEHHFQEVSETVGWHLPVPEEVVNSFGYAALDEGKVQEAIALFRRNVQEHPNSPNAYDSQADGFAEAGMLREAVEAANKAAALGEEFNHPKRADFADHAKKLSDRLAKESRTPR